VRVARGIALVVERVQAPLVTAHDRCS